MGTDLACPGPGGLFRRCLFASAAFHVGLLLMGNARGVRLPNLPRPQLVVDLTLPLRDKASAPAGRLGRPGVPAPAVAPAPAVETPSPLAAPAPPPKPEPAPVSSPDPRPTPSEPAQAVPAAPAAAPLPVGPAGGGSPVLGSPSGSSTGDPAATGGGGAGPGGRSVMVDVMPKLLNKSEVLADLRRFYPEDELRAGREGTVAVKILIEATGAARVVDILVSGGPAFDAAARQVVERMRFSPARAGGTAVPVATHQDIVFKLE